MTESGLLKGFDAKMPQNFVSLDTLLEYRSTIDHLIATMERNLRQALLDQECEFQKTYNEQMKAVQETFGELKMRIDKTLSKEHTDRKYASLYSEKNFFMQHSLYLNEQNKKLIGKVRHLREQIKNAISERDFYKQLATDLRLRVEGGDEQVGQAVQRKVGVRTLPKDIGRQIFGRRSLGVAKENAPVVTGSPGVSLYENKHYDSLDRFPKAKIECPRLTPMDRFSTKEEVPGAPKASRPFFVTTKGDKTHFSAANRSRKNSCAHPGMVNAVWRKMGGYESIKIGNVLREAIDIEPPRVVCDALAGTGLNASSMGRARDKK